MFIVWLLSRARRCTVPCNYWLRSIVKPDARFRKKVTPQSLIGLASINRGRQRLPGYVRRHKNILGKFAVNFHAVEDGHLLVKVRTHAREVLQAQVAVA